MKWLRCNGFSPDKPDEIFQPGSVVTIYSRYLLISLWIHNEIVTSLTLPDFNTIYKDKPNLSLLNVLCVDNKVCYLPLARGPRPQPLFLLQ